MTMSAKVDPRHFDVLIIGAGLSGVGAAWHLKTRCPSKTFAILERRGAIGGTWDLFRYPGIRSDSDMYTLGYSFRPWSGEKAIADGPSILDYVRDTAWELGIESAIRFNHSVVRASWSSSDCFWTLEVATGPDRQIERYSCNFLYTCTGYYDYDEGYMPGWPDMESFTGRIVHPQKWPEDLDYGGRRIVVIGSGATAVTLVPELAKRAAQVTMLQRSPTYIVALPAKDRIARWLHEKLPDRLAHPLVRWKNVLISMFFYNFSRLKPEAMKRLILKGVRRQLGPDYDLRHFTPRYNPWDQRLCLVPNADLFRAIRGGRASVVSDEIETFTETGIRLRSGQKLAADIIVTATGLKLQLLGGMEVWVDGQKVDPAQRLTYKGMMLNDVPNMASAVGYTNASWTLKCELTSEYVCRLLNHMDRNGLAWCAPRMNDVAVIEEPSINLTSGYIQRAKDVLPKQGSRRPWRVYQNYALDLIAFRFAKLDDGVMEFGRRPTRNNETRAA